MSTNTATVEALTAEVRVLMVGNRQVTLSVAKQLDTVGFLDVEAFGRIRGVSVRGMSTGGDKIVVIGRERRTGELVTSVIVSPESPYAHFRDEEVARAAARTFDAWRGLPLIVLAGLR